MTWTEIKYGRNVTIVTEKGLSDSRWRLLLTFIFGLQGKRGVSHNLFVQHSYKSLGLLVRIYLLHTEDCIFIYTTLKHFFWFFCVKTTRQARTVIVQQRTARNTKTHLIINLKYLSLIWVQKLVKLVFSPIQKKWKPILPPTLVLVLALVKKHLQ